MSHIRRITVTSLDNQDRVTGVVAKAIDAAIDAAGVDDATAVEQITGAVAEVMRRV